MPISRQWRACSGGGTCELLDGFAIIVQLTLMLTALAALGIKRWRERPRRPVEIWYIFSLGCRYHNQQQNSLPPPVPFFLYRKIIMINYYLIIRALDVSKQFVGAGTIHFLNLGISYLAGRPGNGRPSTNLCVWYFLSLMTDTTIGIVILWFWLRILEWSLGTFWGIRHLQGGYGDTSSYTFKSMLKRWWKQTLVFVLAEFLMKICIYGLFQLVPSIFDLGDWVLRLIGTDSRNQVVFVMFM